MHPIRSNSLVFFTMLLTLFGGTVFLTTFHQPYVVAEGTHNANNVNKASEGESIAVLELFTSEGCSSCPPADENLQRIAGAATKANQKIFTLSFHVDYWNRLGWKDPFSQAAFSDRQRDYATALSSETYTPQMIVNGTAAFVGSDRKLTDRAIRKALARPATHRIQLTKSEVDSKTPVSFVYNVSGDITQTDNQADATLNIAVATDSETVAVSRGENGGRQLTHVWVVKSLQVIPLNSREGTIKIDPKSVKQDHSRLVVYIQSAATREITGASALEI